MRAVDENTINALDPTSSRRRFFNPDNKDVPQPGDILLTTFRHGDPFAGYCLSIRRRGLDTSVLLRNKIGTVSAEMWVKIFSPNVKGMEVVKRAVKRARRGRLYYYRKPKHDKGSVARILDAYMQKRRLVRKGGMGVRLLASSNRRPGTGREGVGMH